MTTSNHKGHMNGTSPQAQPAGGSPGKKVMMVSTSLGFGGADTQIASISRILRARGWSVSVVSMIPPEPALVETLSPIDVPVHSLDMKPSVPDPRAILRLARLIRTEKPDVLHSHMVHANFLSRLTRLAAPVPALICTAHNTRENSQRGGPTWHKELLYRITDRLADQTTIICEAGYRHYVRRRAVPPSRLKVIPIGVDCAKFACSPDERSNARLDLMLSRDRFIFLTIGRMVVQKDYPNLLRALSLLRNRNWTLLVAGTGPLESDIQELSRRLSLTEHVRFLGVRSDIHRLYHAADAFVLGSDIEGMPVVLLEAAASGLPAVVTDAGGNAEVVVCGVTGFVVPRRNHEALSAAIAEMMNMPAERRIRYSFAARARALEEFEIGSIVSRWESLYQDILAKHRAVGRGLIEEAQSDSLWVGL